jgi:hypothetical protein
MHDLYKATFPEGTTVEVISKSELESFARDWKYHHKLVPEQLAFGGAIAVVKQVSFYHGGDQLYVLENVPGIWNEPCLKPNKEPISKKSV